MGLFDFFRNELIEVIDWTERDRETMVWKFPDRENNIKYGAQLTVRDSQIALFVNEGQIADLYTPGRHELLTENMPVLTSLKSWVHGFDSPFKVDVYFFSTRQFTNLKWGTPQPIMLRDPEFKQVRIKAFGTYSLRIKDPKTFFLEFTGTAPVLRIEELEESLRSTLAAKFAENLAEANLSVLDLVSNYSETAARIKPLLQLDVDRFGIEITDFQIASTSLPPEVEAFYDKMTNMNMVDNMKQYQDFTNQEAIQDAAKAGGGAGVLFTQMTQQNLQPKADQSDILRLLKELGELKTAGILSESEFEAKKKELLDRL